MKHRIILILCLLSLVVVASHAATQLTVTIVKGSITYMTGQGQQLPLEAGDIVDESAVINIPFHGFLELADETAKKKYSIKAPGRAPVSVLIKDERNSVETLPRDYIKNVLGQLTESGAVQGELVTQPAAITRKMATVEKKGVDMDMDFDVSLDMDMDVDLSFTGKDLVDDYRNFRRACVRTYVNYVRETWKSYTGEDPVRMPEEKEVPPMFIPINDNGEEGDPISYEHALANGLKAETTTPEEYTDSWLSYLGNIVKNTVQKVKSKFRKNKQLPIGDVHPEAVKEKPKEVKALVPVAPVPGGGGVNTPFHFTAFGTDFQVRLGDECRFTLSSVTEDAVADAIDALSGVKYDNLLYDCLKIRKNDKLSDWAYYQILKELADKFCGKGTNESTLLLGYLYSQSGYKLRLGRDGDRLLLLLASQHTIYNKPAFKLDGIKFYMLEGDVHTLYICKASFPNETGLSLAISNAQVFDYAPSEKRTIQSRDYPDFKVTVHTNKNLLSFYDTYLPSTINDEVMSRWAFYANTPMSDDVKKELYPQLHAQLDSLSQEEAVDRLLNLIQTGLPYGYDDVIWGHDRSFFAEETLSYPNCDCEDRSILLSRLVRDILGLKTILVYYPGHLAMAIHFTEDVEGDYIMLGNEKYFVCDPTYIAAQPGVTMEGMNNSSAQIILLQ